MAAEIELELAQSTVQATAEGPAATATAVVRNRSAVVDQYTLDVEGLDPAWWDAAPPTVALFPGDEAAVTLHLHPPAGAAAGAHSCRLRVTSGDDPSRVAVAEITLQVAPAGGILLGIEPAAATGRVGRHVVTVSNRRNEAAQLILSGRDKEEALAYRFEPALVAVPAFGEATAALEVRPKSGRLWGRPQAHPFTVQALAEGEEQAAAEAEASLDYRPLIGPPTLPAGRWRWLLALIPLLALAMLVRSLADERSAVESRAAQATATALAVAGSLAGGGAPPLINLLAAKKEAEDPPRGVLVSWDVERGETVAGQLQDVSEGPVDEASRQGKYRLEASGQGGAAAEVVQIVTLGPPIIKRYVAAPFRAPGGDTVRLEWEVSGADAVDIEGLAVDPVQGFRELSGLPPAGYGGSYILQAKNGVGVVSSILYTGAAPAASPPTATGTATPSPTASVTGTPLIVATGTPTAIATPTNTPPVTPTPTNTPPVTPTRTNTPSPTLPPVPCAIGAFSVSPSTGTAPFRGTVTLTWRATGVASIAIRWSDGTGPHEFKSTSASGTTQQSVYVPQPGSVTFNIYGYRDAQGTQQCVGPVAATLTVAAPPTATPTPTLTPTPGLIIIMPPIIILPTPTPVPVGISRFDVSSRCDGITSTPKVDIAWTATGGSDARIYLYRREYTSAGAFVRETPLISGSPALSSSHVDYPNIPLPVDKVNYRLRVTNSAGNEVSQTQPPQTSLIWDYCLN